MPIVQVIFGESAGDECQNMLRGTLGFVITNTGASL